ncbi:MAG: hypothetical protein MUO26_09045 [Methanotrichaceae archaeon]|nr:hypothetical protein [Methanotrichaceae archaeon]
MDEEISIEDLEQGLKDATIKNNHMKYIILDGMIKTLEKLPFNQEEARNEYDVNLAINHLAKVRDIYKKWALIDLNKTGRA